MGLRLLNEGDIWAAGSRSSQRLAPEYATLSALDAGIGYDRLTNRTIIPYLVDRGMLDAQSIVDGRAEVVDKSRRNLNFRVTTTRNQNYLVKQGVGLERATTVRREAEFLTATATGMDDRGFQQHLPRVRDWHSQRRILVFNLIAGSQSLAEQQFESGHWPRDLARQVGTALRRLQRWRLDSSHPIWGVVKRGAPPAVLSIHRPDIHVFEHMSESGLEIIRIIQETPVLYSGFDELRAGWRPSSVIHGDLKWDNVVLLPDSGGQHGQQIHLVDWELVQLGDPLWDAASFLAQYLDTWIASIPIASNSPQSQASAAGIPLESLQPAIREFWEGYTGDTYLDAGDRDAALDWMVRYVAARLVQFAIEADQHSAMLSSTGVVRLQVASNILQRPRVAATSLLGLTA